ncbi:MAG: hypothetical protein LQ347_001676 [Umbilicaria vellea]|nr:MAG: hypothetical protein LQ347_001676 [Umbilicaria vellea]
MEQRSTCQACATRSNWDFIKEFYQREETAKQQVAYVNEALRQAVTINQNNREIMKQTNTHLREIQTGYQASEATRARFENELHDERQEHQFCQESLCQERAKLLEVDKQLNHVWNSYESLSNVLKDVKGQVPDIEGSGDSGDQVRTVMVTDLVMKNQDLARQLDGTKAYIDTLEHQVRVASCETQDVQQQLEEKTIEKDQKVATHEDKISSLECQLYAQQVKRETQPDPPAPESKRRKRQPQTNQHLIKRSGGVKKEGV